MFGVLFVVELLHFHFYYFLCKPAKMGLHMVAVGKLKLLAGGHSNWQLLASLLGPFALKLPFAAIRLPTTCSDLAVTVRLFLFRLNRIFFVDEAAAVTSAAAGGEHRRRDRWERAIRLFRQRAIGRGDARLLRLNDEMFNAISMLSL